jgi:lipopolysaccharide biosynthesis glycosyltransferase
MNLHGSLDYYGKWFFKNKKIKFNYINSGVLLLNLEKIRQTKLFKRAREMCKEKKMFMPDQSSINKLSVGKKIEQRKYNEQRRLKKDTVFQHFTTSFRLLPFFHKVTIKPWNIEKVHKKLKIFEYDDILYGYTSIQKEIKERTKNE